MANQSHLEKMGRELKCPICLSLLNSSVSLGCNHVFCSSCITKSMKAGANCPVCKVPYNRRDVRPAPHMDNLVTIYRNMETDAGVNIFVTQTEQVTSSDCLGNDDNKISNKSKPGKCRGKSKRKCVDVNVQQAKDDNHRTSQLSKLPSFRANKRVHVTPYPLPETPYAEKYLKSRELDNDADNKRSLDVDLQGAKNNTGINEAATCNNDDGALRLSPFFWLRDDVETEDLSRDFLQKEDSSDMQTPNFPSFGVIKDSFEENAFEMRSPSKVADAQILHGEAINAQVFDSEMFEWTQAVCSPELCSIPTLQQNQRSSREPSVPAFSDKENGTKKSSAKRKNKRSKRTRQKKATSYANTVINGFEEIPPKFCSRPSQEARVCNERTEPTTCMLIEGRKCDASFERSNAKTGQELHKIEGSKMKKTKRNEIVDAVVAGGNNRKSAHTKTNICSQNGNSGNDTDVISFVNKKLPLKNDGTKLGKKLKDNSEDAVAGNSAKPNSDNPTGDGWLKKCDSKSVKMKCAFCQSTEETEVSGEVLHYFNGKPVAADHDGNIIHSHRHCAEWAPNVYFEDGTAMNLGLEIARSKRIKCSCCAIKGAALGCYEKSCRKSFHFTCAKQMSQCRWDDENFVMLCPLHLASKLPKEISQNVKQKRVQKNARREHQSSETIKSNTEGNMWEWPLGSPLKWVLCCSALSKLEKELVSDFAKLTGVSVSKEWKPNVTHVIASTDENGACRRTLKVLLGITEGKWILKIDWLKACLGAGKAVGEVDFEINLDNHGIRDGPRLGRMRVDNKEQELFFGLEFFFMGDFDATYKGHLQNLVVAAGGSVIQRKPIPRDTIVDESSQVQTYIIYSCELPQKQSGMKLGDIINHRREEAKKLAYASGAKVASNTWILDSIASCKLSLDV